LLPSSHSELVSESARIIMKQGYIYILSNENRTTLYIGVTNNLKRRVLEHKSGYGSIFTERYNLHDLLYYEEIMGMQNAINREKQLKNWHKDWKWNLIKEENQELKDIAADWFSKEDIESTKQMLKQVQHDSKKNRQC